MSYSPDEKVKQDYIQNKLAPEDKLEFETWLFNHPHEQEELELELILKAGVQKYYKDEKVNKASKVGWMPAFGMAAAFVLMSWGLLMPHDEDGAKQGLIAPQISVFSQVRSAEQMTWSLDGAIDQLIQIPVAYLSNDAYQVEITGSSSFQIKDLQPQLDMVSLVVYKNTLKAGKYQLKITNQSNQEQQLFDFQIN